MKKAVVFGGCGENGKVVVRDLVEYSDFDPIVIADIREEVSRAFINELGASERVTFQKVNAYDQPSLIAALEGATIAVNTIGPFFEFASLMANAVYRAGVNYVDVCDDPDATTTLLSMDSMVARKGLTFLICQVWPGPKIWRRRSASPPSCTGRMWWWAKFLPTVTGNGCSCPAFLNGRRYASRTRLGSCPSIMPGIRSR
jgi:hypothetical protein